MDQEREHGLKKDVQEPESAAKRDSDDTEFAAETMPAPLITGGYAPMQKDNAATENTASRIAETDENEAPARTQGRTLGWVALGISILALFMYPAVMGTTAALVGVFAYSSGAKALGAWSIVIGLVALLTYFIFTPTF